jgi:Flp pilus assembly protein TadD
MPYARESLSRLEPLESEATPDIALSIAKLRAELGDTHEAEQTLVRAIARYPNHTELAEQCAYIRLSLGQADGALLLLVPFEPDARPYVALMIARARAELGDMLAASETLIKALTRHPGHLGLIEQCAQYQLKLGQAAGALALLAPLEVDARPAIAFMIARARAELGDPSGAAETLANAFKRHPGDLSLAEHSARYRMKSGDAKGALAILVPLNDQLAAPALAVMARAASEIGDPVQAEAIIMRGLQTHPNDLVLTEHLARLCLDAGRSRDAVTLLAQIEPDAEPAQLLLLAKARLYSGDPMSGLATLELGVERYPENSDLLGGLASARLSMGDAKSALLLLDRVPEPRDVRWFIARAQSFEVLGDVAGHEAAIRQGLISFPADLYLQSELSKSLASQGRLEEAAAVKGAIEDNVVAKPDNIAGFVTSHFIFGDAQGTADLISRVVAKLEAAEISRASIKALIDLIAGARLLLPEIGVPILRRIIARIDGHAAALSVEQLILLATASGAAGDVEALRRYLVFLIPRLELVKDIIETLSLAAWADDRSAIAAIEETFQRTVAGADVNASKIQNVRLFSDKELGVGGFDIGGRAVAFLFPGLYSLPSVTQEKIALAMLARGIDFVPMMDMRRDVLLSGIGPSTSGREESFAALKRFIAQRGYQRVIAIGLSGGGMPAAIYGDAISADRIVVFSTGTFFPPNDDRLERRARAFLDKVRKPGLDVGSDNLEIWKSPGAHPPLHIHYPAGNRQDARHALRMAAAPNVFLYPVQTAQHDFYSTLGTEQLVRAILGVEET